MIHQSGRLRQLLLQELQNTSYAAHPGVRKTTFALLEWVWWPNLAMDVSALLLGAKCAGRQRMLSNTLKGYCNFCLFCNLSLSDVLLIS